AAGVAWGRAPMGRAGGGGGPLRMPAASCGLFGLKPQRGRISLAPEPDGWNGMVVVGSVTRTVLDSALWLDICSGGSEEPGAPSPPERPFVQSAQTPPGKLRVAWSTAPPRTVVPAKPSEAVQGAVAGTADLLCSLGHEVAQRDPDWGWIGNNLSARFLRGVSDEVARVPHPERLERRTRGFGRLGAAIPDGLFEKALQARHADAARVTAIFDSCDVLMMPVMCGTALPVRRWEGQGALRTSLGMNAFYPY